MIVVGCCGTGGLKFEEYVKRFNAIELQETFYRRVKPTTLKKRREVAGEDFIFTMKAFQGITHPASSPTWRRSGWKPEPPEKYGLLRPTRENFELWQEILDNAEAISAKAVVIQLPPSFAFTDEAFEGVKEFFREVPSKVEVAIEFRHRSWFREDVGKWLYERGIIQALDPFTQPLIVKTEKAYFRLHGLAKGYRYQYTTEELKKLRDMMKKGYVMFNNLTMVEDCSRFLDLLAGGTGELPALRERLKDLKLKFPIKAKELVRRYGYIRVNGRTLEEALVGVDVLESEEVLLRLVEKG